LRIGTLNTGVWVVGGRRTCGANKTGPTACDAGWRMCDDQGMTTGFSRQTLDGYTREALRMMAAAERPDGWMEAGGEKLFGSGGCSRCNRL
ncbi:hypothetical protein S83_057878, partial [Arachis hypogaea]